MLNAALRTCIVGFLSTGGLCVEFGGLGEIGGLCEAKGLGLLPTLTSSQTPR
jgi:hypothetical protein